MYSVKLKSIANSNMNDNLNYFSIFHKMTRLSFYYKSNLYIITQKTLILTTNLLIKMAIIISQLLKSKMLIVIFYRIVRQASKNA